MAFGLPSSGHLGDIGFKTLAYYAATTGVAVAIGLAVVFVISPGTKESSQKSDKIEAWKSSL